MFQNGHRQRKPVIPTSGTPQEQSCSLSEQKPSEQMPAKETVPFYRTLSRWRIGNLLILLSSLLLLYLFVLNRTTVHAPVLLHTPRTTSSAASAAAAATTRHHLLFAIAASSRSWPLRQPYVRLWCSPNSTRAVVYLDRAPADHSASGVDRTLPPVVISADTSKFPYTFPKGLKSAVRVARIVKEAVDRTNETEGIRWFVFGDDDTVFFVDNLAKTLSKYDHNQWFYIGSNSEGYEQNFKFAFEMAFGGGGFAISHALARVLARVLDSCLMRYSHLYGSDGRIYSCLVELGVGLTHEPGFHQLDMRGNLFGMLSSHPLSPLLSLHHLDAADPIFPNMNRTPALEHLFKAVNVDTLRILQQTICYDRSSKLTASVSWGYAVQIYEGVKPLPDLLLVQRTFMPWRRGSKVDLNHFMLSMREYPRDPCKRPAVFFMDSVVSNESDVQSNYVKHVVQNCTIGNTVKNLENIRVSSQKLELDVEEMKSPRRLCCDISSAFSETMVIKIRRCGEEELISMHG